jgi:hypothetical protein
MKRLFLFILCCVFMPVISLAARPKINKDTVELHGDMMIGTTHYNKYHAMQIDEDPPINPPYWEVIFNHLKLQTPQDRWQFEQGFLVLSAAQFAAAVPETFPKATGQTWAQYTAYFTCNGGTWYLIIIDRGGFGQSSDCRKNPPTIEELALYSTTFPDYVIPKQQGLDLITAGTCVP